MVMTILACHGVEMVETPDEERYVPKNLLILGLKHVRGGSISEVRTLRPLITVCKSLHTLQNEWEKALFVFLPKGVESEDRRRFQIGPNHDFRVIQRLVTIDYVVDQVDPHQ